MDKCRERMKAAIDKYGYTYEQLEGLTGVAKSSIQRYIVGETEKIPVDFVAKLANITNTSASYLAGFENKETIPQAENKTKSKNNQPSLVIEIDNGEREIGVVVRVNDKANALLEDVIKKSKKSKSYVASKMIEYAYEFIEYIGE